MQVSWIDAERIKALVAQLEMPAPRMEEAPEIVELHTTPEAVPASSDEAWGFFMNTEEPAAPASVLQPVPNPVHPEPATPVLAETAPVAFADDAEESESGESIQPLQSPASALPLSRIRDKLRAIRQRASDAGILSRTPGLVSSDQPPPPASVPEKAPPPVVENGASSSLPAVTGAVRTHKIAFESPRGSREVRLAAFAGWARQVLHEEGGGNVLVMRDDGEVLWGGGEARSGLVLSTMMACGAAMRASLLSARETPAVIHQPLSSGYVLTVIPCETTGGIVHAAVAASTGLSHEQAHQLRGALCAAMN